MDEIFVPLDPHHDLMSSSTQNLNFLHDNSFDLKINSQPSSKEKLLSNEVQPDSPVTENRFGCQFQGTSFNISGEGTSPDICSPPSEEDKDYLESSYNNGLPDKYFLPSPSTYHNAEQSYPKFYDENSNADLLSYQSCASPELCPPDAFDKFSNPLSPGGFASESDSNMVNSYLQHAEQMTRGEPMGEESEEHILTIFTQQNLSNFATQPSTSNKNADVTRNKSAISEIDSSCSIEDDLQPCGYGPEGIERPPLVGQSNDSKRQVASGMSSNSDTNSSIKSSVSGDFKNEGNDLYFRDSLSVKVSLLLADDINQTSQSLSLRENFPSTFHHHTDVNEEHLSTGEDEISEFDTKKTFVNHNGINDCKFPSLTSDSNHSKVHNIKLESQAPPEEKCDFLHNVNIGAPLSAPGNEESMKRSFESVGFTGSAWKTKTQVASLRVNRFEPIEIETDKDVIDIRPSSPTSVSSVASSKRLEWDSGADIGYKALSSSGPVSTDLELAQWANKSLAPLTRTEPEGKSCQKEKRKPVFNIKDAQPVILEVSSDISEQNSNVDSTSEDPNNEELVRDLESQLPLAKTFESDSSMNSITSEIFQEVLYGNGSDITTGALLKSEDDEVIARVKRLLDHSSRTDAIESNSECRNAEEKYSVDCCDDAIMLEKNLKFCRGSVPHEPRKNICDTQKFSSEVSRKCSFPEVSPSHSSSSWSIKSSNTVVLTPISQNNEESASVESNDNTLELNENIQPAAESFNPESLLQHGNKFRKVISVSVQTNSCRSGLSVPRPVFPFSKSRSLDILPTLMVDASVNTIYPYTPTSEENLSCYKSDNLPSDVQEQKPGYLKNFKFSVRKNPDENVSCEKLKNKGINMSNLEINMANAQVTHIKSSTNLDKTSPEVQMSLSRGFQPQPKEARAITKPQQEGRFNHVLPYWPPGSKEMYYTVQESVSTCSKTNDSPLLMSRNQPAFPSDSLQSEANNTYICTDRSSAVDTESNQISYEPVLHTQKSLDTNVNSWLRAKKSAENRHFRKAVLHSKQLNDSSQQNNSCQSSYPDNDHTATEGEWQNLDIDTSLSTDISVSAHSADKENRQNYSSRRQVKRTNSALMLQIERLKELVRQQRLSTINRLLREIKKIERLEAMIPSPKQSATTSSLSPDRSDKMYLMNKFLKPRLPNKNPCKNEMHSSSCGFLAGTKTSPDNRRNSEKFVAAHETISRPHKVQTRDFSQLCPSPSPTITSVPLPKSGANNHEAISRPHKVQTRDFSQLCPSPSPATSSVHLQKTEVNNHKAISRPHKAQTRHFSQLCPSPSAVTSVALQTTPSLNGTNHLASNEKKSPRVKKPIGWVIPVSRVVTGPSDSEEKITLQEAFKSQFVNAGKVKCRHEKLSQAKCERQKQIERNKIAAIEKAFDIIQNINVKKDSNVEINVKKSKLERIFTHKEMRAQTERLYDRLPEVRLKKIQEKRMLEHDTNRILTQLFNQKIQGSTLNGKVSWLLTQKCLQLS